MEIDLKYEMVEQMTKLDVWNAIDQKSLFFFTLFLEGLEAYPAL